MTMQGHKISPKFVSEGLIDNNSTSVKVMPWHQTGGMPLPEPMMTQFTDDMWHHQATMI